MLGTWCTLCLAAALAMLIMIPFAIDEVVAMGQYLWWAARHRKPLLRIFFQGGAVEAGSEDTRDALESFGAFRTDSIRGITVPWSLAVVVLAGALLMLTRLLFGHSGPMADSDHVAGALVITVAIIATAEVVRPLRLLNVPIGLWVAASPFFLPGETAFGSVAAVVLGLGLALLSLPRGRRSDEHYASWDRFVI